MSSYNGNGRKMKTMKLPRRKRNVLLGRRKVTIMSRQVRKER